MGVNDQYTENIRILSRYKKSLSNDCTNCPPQIEKVVNYIHEYLFEEGLTVASVKDECHILGKSFSPRFVLCMGLSPKKYILHHRIEASKLLLQQRGVTITEAALLTGFSSLSAYCNSFKRKEGMKPSEWRLQNGGG
jgi:AraC family transcriptional regulator